jgi:hypothetical protein
MKPKRKRRDKATPSGRSMRPDAPRRSSHRDFLQDGPARVRALLWSISVTFVYAVVNDLLLDRPQSKVSSEAFVACIVTMAIQIAIFYKRRSGRRPVLSAYLWNSFERLVHYRFAVSSIAFVLVLNATPVANIEPAIAAASLRKSEIGLIPGMDSGLQGTDPSHRFRQASNRIERAIQERKLGDPEELSKVKNSLVTVVENLRLHENVSEPAKVELAYLQSYELLSRAAAANPTILQPTGVWPGNGRGMTGYGPDKTRISLTPDFNARSFLFFDEPNPGFFSGFAVIAHSPGKPTIQFAIVAGENRRVVFNNLLIQGMAQDIGNLTWTNVTFDGCVIRYHGQPVAMGNVTFVNSTFEYSPDGKGKDLLDYISAHQNEKLSAYVP